MRFLTVSFDYELAWGTYEMVKPRYLFRNVAHENEAAERVLIINEQLQIPASWGMVGAAIDPAPLHSRLERCAALGAPVSKLAALLESTSQNERRRITQIPQTFHDRLRRSTQEAAGHSYSHSYPETLTRSSLEADFAALRSALGSNGYAQPMIYIAPKNRVTSDSRDLAAAYGFCSVRESPPTPLYDPPPPWMSGIRRRLVRLGRYADALIGVDEFIASLDRQTERDVPADSAVTGNFFFRPNLATSRLGRLHLLRLQRFASARFSTDRHVHLWTHPHNFGSNLKASTAFYRDTMRSLLALAGRYSVPVIAPSQVSAREG